VIRTLGVVLGTSLLALAPGVSNATGGQGDGAAVRQVATMSSSAPMVSALSPSISSAAPTAVLAVDTSVKTHQSTAATTITSGSLSTTQANDLLIAFITSDGPSTALSQSFATVSGGGLTWKLRERTNVQPGTAEIWEAAAPTVLSNVTVTATRSSGSYGGAMDVVAFSGADTSVDGAVGTANAPSGAPNVSLTTTRAGSWVWGVGDDYDNAIARTVGSAQTKFDEYLSPSGDTYWTQSQAAAGNTNNTLVTLNDTAPTSDRWDFSGIEILPAVVDNTPPTPPTNLNASASNSNLVGLSWTASTDNVGVAGYRILRNSTLLTSISGTTYADSSVSPSTTYSYAVQAYDAAGNVSASSNTASATTPPATTNPPVISSVAAGSITPSSAMITWTTDIPSSSQVFYGTTASYGQSTTFDSTQVTRHSQTLNGLTAGTTYHYDVQSTGSTSNTGTSADGTFSTSATNVTLPDMQIKVPTGLISIGTNSGTGHPQLQFTHITWDAGTGPFEIDPTYNSSTGTATFTQAIYNSPSPGVWTFDHSAPVSATAVFHSPSDYQFPLTKFTLNNVNSDGSLGSVVATSPKTDYCMTADVIVGGVPNTPNQSYIPQSNCTDPTKPLGWSVGWGDQYDQTDAGQPIDLTGIADGTYILHALVDPSHVLTESNASNNVTDTLMQISGGAVSIISQTNPGATPPTINVTSPTNGATVSGTVSVQANAAATSPANVASVQFYLDGQLLGSPVTSAPYVVNWDTTKASNAVHALSAKVTDTSGSSGTSANVTVTVQNAPSPDTTPPTVSITNPTNSQTVSGTIPVAANASDNVAVASVQFYLDGQPLGNPVTSAPYAVNWDTTKASNSSHVLTAKATDPSGNVGTATNVNVTVQNPAPPMTCFVLQTQVSVHGRGSLTTAAFHTAAAGEVLVAFVSADGPSGGGKQSATVSGSGLTWTLVKRANALSGDAEVWEATAPAVLSSATVKSTLSSTSYNQDLTIIAMEGVKGVGASVAASGSTGAPSTKLTTSGATSLIFAVGHDYSNAIARTLPAGWVSLDQWVDTSTGDTYWSQYTNNPTGPAGTVVTVNDLAPTTDQWNLVAVELLNSGS